MEFFSQRKIAPHFHPPEGVLHLAFRRSCDHRVHFHSHQGSEDPVRAEVHRMDPKGKRASTWEDGAPT